MRGCILLKALGAHHDDVEGHVYPPKRAAQSDTLSARIVDVIGVSGIYLSFLLTVIAATIARARGWVPQGAFRLGRWAWPVNIAALAYLGLMFVNIVVPTGLTSPRGYFNLDWITLTVMVIIAIVGDVYFLIARPDTKAVNRHLHDDLEPTGAEVDKREVA